MHRWFSVVAVMPAGLLSLFRWILFGIDGRFCAPLLWFGSPAAVRIYRSLDQCLCLDTSENTTTTTTTTNNNNNNNTHTHIHARTHTHARTDTHTYTNKGYDFF